MAASTVLQLTAQTAAQKEIKKSAQVVDQVSRDGIY
jgi:hypothetical protein